MNKMFNQYEWLFSLAARMALAAIFILSGVNKLQNYAGTQGYMAAMGVPEATLPLVILCEIVGAIAIIIGFQLQKVAFLLAGFCIVTALLFHFDLSDQNQFIHFFKNIAMAGGFLALVANGARAMSLDKKVTD